MTSSTESPSQGHVPPQKHKSHEKIPAERSNLWQAIEFLGDLPDELGLLALLVVVVFFLAIGAGALMLEGFSSGGPPPGPGLGS